MRNNSHLSTHPDGQEQVKLCGGPCQWTSWTSRRHLQWHPHLCQSLCVFLSLSLSLCLNNYCSQLLWVVGCGMWVVDCVSLGSFTQTRSESIVLLDRRYNAVGRGVHTDDDDEEGNTAYVCVCMSSIQIFCSPYISIYAVYSLITILP